MSDVQNIRQEIHKIYQISTGKDLSQESIPEIKCDDADMESRIGEETKVIHSLLNRYAEPQPAWVPPVKVEESASDLTIHIEIPGVPDDAISVSLDNCNLTVSGEKTSNIGEGSVQAINEITEGKFFRVFPLSEYIDQESLEQSHSDGVMTVSFSKKDTGKQK